MCFAPHNLRNRKGQCHNWKKFSFQTGAMGYFCGPIAYHLFNKYSLKPSAGVRFCAGCGIPEMQGTVQLNEKMPTSCPPPVLSPIANMQAWGSSTEGLEVKISWKDPKLRHSPASIQHGNCLAVPNNQEE